MDYECRLYLLRADYECAQIHCTFESNHQRNQHIKGIDKTELEHAESVLNEISKAHLIQMLVHFPTLRYTKSANYFLNRFDWRE